MPSKSLHLKGQDKHGIGGWRKRHPQANDHIALARIPKEPRTHRIASFVCTASCQRGQVWPLRDVNPNDADPIASRQTQLIDVVDAQSGAQHYTKIGPFYAV